ncbi:MAG: hypothetical protein V8R85_04270 [Frisingicoccus sp.]
MNQTVNIPEAYKILEDIYRGIKVGSMAKTRRKAAPCGRIIQ